MSRLDWPEAFAIVFGVVPLVIFGIAVLCAFPAVVLPVLATTMGAVCLARRQARRDALAARCAAEYPFAATLVAAPLPDLPTVPMRRQL